MRYEWGHDEPKWLRQRRKSMTDPSRLGSQQHRRMEMSQAVSSTVSSDPLRRRSESANTQARATRGVEEPDAEAGSVGSDCPRDQRRGVDAQ